MFQKLIETVHALNADVNNVANSEKAKKLRKKLLSIGLPMAIGGFLGVFVCFVLFATAGMSGFSKNGFSARLIVPFVLFLPCGVIGGIGLSIASLGFQIVVTGYTSNLIDENVGERCPGCGERITSNQAFCPSCGAKLKKKCPNCGHINGGKADYCEECGTKLDA